MPSWSLELGRGVLGLTLLPWRALGISLPRCQFFTQEWWGSLASPEGLLPPPLSGVPVTPRLYKEPTQYRLEGANRPVCKYQCQPPKHLVNCEAHSGCLHAHLPLPADKGLGGCSGVRSPHPDLRRGRGSGAGSARGRGFSHWNFHTPAFW